MKLTTLGGILIAGAALSAAVMQISGNGLVTSSAATAPLQVTKTGRNLTVTVKSPNFTLHPWRIGPIAGLAVLGLICFFVPGRGDAG